MINEKTVLGKENNGEIITLGDLQLRLKDMLKDVIKVFEDNGVYYFAAEGTMLGAIRHSDMIPWDDDIDLGFKLQDYKKIVNLLTTNLDNKYDVQCFDTNNKYAVTQPMIKVRLRNTYVEYNAWYDRNNCGCNGIFIDLIAFSNCCPTNNDHILRRKSYFRSILLVGLNYLKLNNITLKERHLRIAHKYNEEYKDSKMIGYALNYIPWKKYMFSKNDFEDLIDVKFSSFTIKVPKKYDTILRQIYGDYTKMPENNKIKLDHSKNIKLKSSGK